MNKSFETFTYGKVTLRECFDPDTSMNGEGFVEVSDENDDVIAVIQGDYDLDELDSEEVEELIDKNLRY